MSANSKIQWTDDTWNPWEGCAKVSPACLHCYAEALVERFGKDFKVRRKTKRMNDPLRWNENSWVCNGCGHAHPEPSAGLDTVTCCPDRSTNNRHRRRVFSLSLGDWLDDAVPIEWLADMLDVIRLCPNLDFLLLTKRPENWRERLALVHATTKSASLGWWVCQWLHTINPTPPHNVWIGCTVENQEYADKRIPELLKIPAVCRFVSYEPALGPVDFSQWLGDQNAEQDTTAFHNFHHPEDGIHWIIVGGESGPKARPFNIDWARSTIEQCKAAGVACFVKQMGGNLSDETLSEFARATGRSVKDKKGGDMAEWPADLRVREFPNVEVRS